MCLSCWLSYRNHLSHKSGKSPMKFLESMDTIRTTSCVGLHLSEEVSVRWQGGEVNRCSCGAQAWCSAQQVFTRSIRKVDTPKGNGLNRNIRSCAMTRQEPTRGGFHRHRGIGRRRRENPRRNVT